MTKRDRRDFLKGTAGVGGAAALASPLLGGCMAEFEDDDYVGEQQQAAQTKDDAKIFNKYFKFEVKGIYNEVPGCTNVSGGDLTITVEESTQGDRPDYREYTYGSHEYGDLTFTVQTGPGMVKLQEWADKAMKVGGSGNALRRDCSLYLLARDKTTVMRTINYFGCYPVSCNAGDHSTSSEIKSITFTCNVDRIEETKG